MITFLLVLSGIKALLFLLVVIFAKGDNSAKVLASALALFELMSFAFFITLKL